MTAEITILSVILGVLVMLFITELLRVDIVALLCMISLAWTGLLTPAEAFSGFSSNAVISIIAVMILGYGIEQCGLMKKLAAPIVTLAGKSENRLICLVSLTVGGISSFMQNIGAAALFLPALRRISRESGIPAARLVMPMGFAVILGGTVTMVGSGPLILLNDLLHHSGLKGYGLFAVTPVGAVLLASGILYFVAVGKHLLPLRSDEKSDARTQEKLIDTLNLNTVVHLMCIPPNSSLIGKTRDRSGLWDDYHINLLAVADYKEVDYAPWRMTRFNAGQSLALFGCDEDVRRFYADYGLTECYTPQQFNYIMNPDNAGFAELIVRPGSSLAGKTLRQIALRKNFDVEPVMMLKGSKEIRGDFSDIQFEPGDIIIVYGLWEKIGKFKDNEDFILSSQVENKTAGKYGTFKVGAVLLGVLAGVVLGVKLPLILLSGVLLLLFMKVITMDEAYKAVDWRTVFLIAGLIPLGVAMEKTGAALLISRQMMSLLQGSHVFILMLAMAALATLFSLFISNVAAVVLLVPMAINLARSAGIDPAVLALLTAICSSNSFLLPTNQVNAFLMSPGGYRTRDYIKTGGILTVLFIFICTGVMYLVMV